MFASALYGSIRVPRRLRHPALLEPVSSHDREACAQPNRTLNYLKRAQQGEEIVVTSHGKTIARIIPDRQESEREVAAKRLEALRGTVIAGDILAPLDEEWTGDADHL